jgi:hypothetical protein
MAALARQKQESDRSGMFAMRGHDSTDVIGLYGS